MWIVCVPYDIWLRIFLLTAIRRVVCWLLAEQISGATVQCIPSRLSLGGHRNTDRILVETAWTWRAYLWFESVYELIRVYIFDVYVTTTMTNYVLVAELRLRGARERDNVRRRLHVHILCDSLVLATSAREAQRDGATPTPAVHHRLRPRAGRRSRQNENDHRSTRLWHWQVGITFAIFLLMVEGFIYLKRE